MSDWIVVPSEHFSDFFSRNDECLGKVTRDIFNVYMYLGPVEIYIISHGNYGHNMSVNTHMQNMTISVSICCKCQYWLSYSHIERHRLIDASREQI